MSPSSQSRPNILETDPEIGLEGSNLLFFPPIFDNLQLMTFQCLSRLSVFPVPLGAGA